MTACNAIVFTVNKLIISIRIGQTCLFNAAQNAHFSLYFPYFPRDTLFFQTSAPTLYIRLAAVALCPLTIGGGGAPPIITSGGGIRGFLASLRGGNDYNTQ